MSAGNAACPVCSLPAGSRTRCAECGWELRTAWRQGHADRSGFAAALQEAVLDHDLRAAARLGDDWKPYAAWLRGVPDENAWIRARTRPGPPVRPLRPLLARVLPMLGDADTLAVFETGAEGVAVTLVRAGELERPDVPTVRHDVSWEELLPMLARDPAHRRFQLAGGLAGLDRAALETALSGRLSRWAEGLAEGAVRIAVCRAPGWTVPEQAVRSLGSMTAREAGEVRAALDGTRAELPLRVPYGLLVAAVNPADQAVRLITRPLFAAGTLPGASGRTSVGRVPGAASGDTVLAVVTEEPVRRLVSAWSGPLGPGESQEVEVLLEAPGRVRLVRPAGLAAEPRSLPELEGLAPARLDLRSGRVELICLIELNGPEEAVRRRRELLSGLFGLLAEEAPGRVCAAVLGYGEHFARNKNPAVVHGDWLRPLPEAREVLEALPARGPAFYPHAAPLEDALHEVVERGRRDRFVYSRILLVLAGRPAHPPVTPLDDVDRPAHACPHRLDWRSSTGRLDLAAKVIRRYTVLDRLDEETRAEPLWRELGRDLLAELPGTAPRRLAVAMNLISADPVRCPFPLADAPAR